MRLILLAIAVLGVISTPTLLAEDSNQYPIRFLERVPDGDEIKFFINDEYIGQGLLGYDKILKKRKSLASGS